MRPAFTADVSTLVPFKQAKLVVPVKVTPWPAGRHERVSINSFGIGGANARMYYASTYYLKCP
jgi:acyl transferase domain-containing protein